MWALQVGLDDSSFRNVGCDLGAFGSGFWVLGGKIMVSWQPDWSM